MFSITRSAALVVAVAAATQPAFADCSNEVAQGIVRQSNETMWRKEANIISDQGPLKMTVEFVKPDRMRQVVSLLIDPKPIETILVGKAAWSNAGGEWKSLNATDTEQFVKFFQSTTSQGINDVGDFECMGAETLEGKKLRAYKGLPPPVNLPEGATDKQKADAEAQRQKNEAVRMVYLDTETGLPERSLIAQPGKLDKPLFKEVYSYPKDIKIEPPANVRP
jgi:hypothetical protein